MPRTRWYHYLIIFLVFLVLAFIISNPLEPAGMNGFISWITVGIWLVFTVKFIGHSNYMRQIGSPHSKSFFIAGSYFVAYLSSIWGNFTTILGTNLTGTAWFYVSPWMLIFSLPYVLYSIHAIQSTFRTYFSITVGTRTVNARKFGVGFVVLIVILVLLYYLMLFDATGAIDFAIEPVVRYVDPFQVILILSGIIVAARYGRQPSIPDLRRPVTRVQSRPVVQPRPVPATTTRLSRPPASTVPSQPASPVSRTTAPRTRVAPSIHPQGLRVRVGGTKSPNLDELRPKAGVLSKEDFKCIFCFNIPKLPEDENRGIVLCPTCRHPAHADEFKDWMRNSTLCSRCDARIPESFRRNPKIVSTRVYLEAMKKFAGSIKG